MPARLIRIELYQKKGKKSIRFIFPLEKARTTH